MRTFFNILFIATAVGVGLYFSRAPWQVYQQQKEISAKAAVQMRQAESERADLARKNAKLESSAGQEEQARQQGYLGPREEPVPTH